MPSKYLKVKNKPRGVANRMAGLTWVRKNAREGVLYFADDDNTYDIRIFEQVIRLYGFSHGLYEREGEMNTLLT